LRINFYPDILFPDLIPNVKFESKPKTFFLLQKHEISPKIFIEFQSIVLFGVLEIWWHFIFSNFSEWIQVLHMKSLIKKKGHLAASFLLFILTILFFNQ